MTPARYLNRPKALMDYANPDVAMPYGMDANGIVAAIEDVYSYLFALNHESLLFVGKPQRHHEHVKDPNHYAEQNSEG